MAPWNVRIDETDRRSISNVDDDGNGSSIDQRMWIPLTAVVAFTLIVLVFVCACCTKQETHREKSRRRKGGGSKRGGKRQSSHQPAANDNDELSRLDQMDKATGLPTPAHHRHHPTVHGPHDGEKKKETKKEQPGNAPETIDGDRKATATQIGKKQAAATVLPVTPTVEPKDHHRTPADAQKSGSIAYQIMPRKQLLEMARRQPQDAGPARFFPVAVSYEPKADGRTNLTPTGNSVVMTPTKIQPGRTKPPVTAGGHKKKDERLDYVHGDQSEYGSLADIEDVFTPSHMQKFKEEVEQMRKMEQERIKTYQIPDLGSKIVGVDVAVLKKGASKKQSTTAGTSKAKYSSPKATMTKTATGVSPKRPPQASMQMATARDSHPPPPPPPPPPAQTSLASMTGVIPDSEES